MPVRLDKRWIALTESEADALPGQLGVYELADMEHQIIFIGKADARSLFGLRGEIRTHLEAGEGAFFRYEVNTAYLTRYQELLMVYIADFSVLPSLNKDNPDQLGRLSPL